ncbi:MAG: FAD-dependent oxidoreductase [Candidatus Doudnabacteria bacterium]|nr:FAD-dependent oxidoreductase [Candidatus Doudnabacteria bacterium]
MNNLEKKHIVILGGGFAGVACALELKKLLADNDEYEIVLIDKKAYQTYHAGLYEAATTEHGLVEAKKVKRAVTIPYTDIFGKTKIKVFKAYIDKINLPDGKIITDSRILSSDYLLIALGSVADFYGIPNLDKHGFTLKSLEDAVMIRNRVEDLVLHNDKVQIVVGGGGFAGAEFAGELHNLLQKECLHHNKKCENFKVMVVEGAPGFLPGLSDKVSKLVYNRLSGIGIETKFSTLITEAGKDYVVLNNTERVSCDLLVWTGGVRSCRLPLAINSILERDKKDRTPVTEFLNLKSFPNVFVAGDDACVLEAKTKKPLPQTAQEAIRQGKHAGRNIFRLIHGRQPLPYHPGPTRFVIPVSGKYAILYTPNLIISGFVGWAIRRLADMRYFLSILPFWKALSYWMFENKIFTKND